VPALVCDPYLSFSQERNNNMPAPLIAAAASVVARYIAKKGLQAAGKKFTKKAIAEGKKHAKDMVTKPTAGQAKVKAATKGQRVYRAGTRAGAAVGAGAVGVTAAAKVKSLKGDLKNAKTEAERARLQTQIEKAVAKVRLEEANGKATATSLRPKARTTSKRPKARPKTSNKSNVGPSGVSSRGFTKLGE
jgi:hypothetical protein